MLGRLMTITAPHGKIAVIEYLRGYAALSVAWYHMTLPRDPGFTRSAGGLGWTGVDIFFVISGFVLPLSIWGWRGSEYRLRDFPNFFLRRLIRIEPPYLISLALASGLLVVSAYVPGFAGKPYEFSLGQVLSHIAYLPRVFGYPWIQAIYWTLALEFCFYILIGLIFSALLKWPVPVLSSLLIVVGALSIEGYWEPRSLLFGVGASVFLARIGRVSRTTGTVLCIVFATIAGVNAHFVTIAALATALLIHLGCGKRLPPPFHNALMWLGAMSYSIYIMHVPFGGRVVNFGERFATTEAQSFLVAVLGLIASIIAGWVFYVKVERRFVKLSKRAKRSDTELSAQSDDRVGSPIDGRGRDSIEIPPPAQGI